MWSALTIRDIGDGDDGLLYPIPLEGTNAVRLEPSDGSSVKEISAKGLDTSVIIDGKSESLVSGSDIKATLRITDSRLVIACSKYDKGGGWIGGASSLALNAASKARAAFRTRGKSLVGHVRYPWLVQVGFASKTGWLSEERVRVVVPTLRAEGNVLVHTLVLTLPKQVSAESVARDLTSRAASYKLAHMELNDDERERLEALRNPPTLTPVKGEYSVWKFTNALPVAADTAYGDRGDQTTS